MDFRTFQTRWKYPTAEVRRDYAQISEYGYCCILGAALLFVFASLAFSLKPEKAGSAQKES